MMPSRAEFAWTATLLESAIKRDEQLETSSLFEPIDDEATRAIRDRAAHCLSCLINLRVVAHRRETTARDASAQRHTYLVVLRDLFCNAPQRRLAG